MSVKEPYKIFVSCGTPFTPQVEEFVTAIRSHLEFNGCTPQTVGQGESSVRQPIFHARRLIAACEGAVVIAFERVRIIEGIDKPGVDPPNLLKNEAHPTVWNHMEAAMAYAQDVPILLMVQKGLKRQGMLSDRSEWHTQEIDFTVEFLRSKQFNQVFQEWLSLVQERREKPKKLDFDPSEIELKDLLSRLTPKKFWSLLTTAVGLLAVVATTAFKLGQYFHAH
jgi:hypothetical protein